MRMVMMLGLVLSVYIDVLDLLDRWAVSEEVDV